MLEQHPIQLDDSHSPSPAQHSEAQRHYQVVAQAIEYIRHNALQQPTLAEVAAAVNLSEYHLQRLFAAWAGISPKRFLQFLTKEHAKAALRQSTDTLTTALESGLSGTSRLHDLMVSCEAMTPGEIRNLGAGVVVYYGVAETPFGTALLGWTRRGVCFLEFCDGDPSEQLVTLAQHWPEASLEVDQKQAARLAQEIFPDEPKPGRLHLLLRGTNFQIKVWEALLNTAPGDLVSYGQLATLAGSPNAQRAVGSALASNTLGYLIPCHRVIKGSGEIGNYRWGETRKLAIHGWEQGQLAALSADR